VFDQLPRLKALQFWSMLAALGSQVYRECIIHTSHGLLAIGVRIDPFNFDDSSRHLPWLRAYAVRISRLCISKWPPDRGYDNMTAKRAYILRGTLFVGTATHSLLRNYRTNGRFRQEAIPAISSVTCSIFTIWFFGAYLFGEPDWRL
jgi:hypothetical protein